MLHIRLHKLFQCPTHFPCYNLETVSICAYQWGGGGREGVCLYLAKGEGVNAKREGLQILDPQRLASLFGNFGISVRIHTQT